MRKRRKKSWEIWQRHHLEYQPELIVRITRTEHFFCGRIDSYAKAHGLSVGMRKALKYYCKKYSKPSSPSLRENKNLGTDLIKTVKECPAL